jgi:hypothetical protein
MDSGSVNMPNMPRQGNGIPIADAMAILFNRSAKHECTHVHVDGEGKAGGEEKGEEQAAYSAMSNSELMHAFLRLQEARVEVYNRLGKSPLHSDILTWNQKLMDCVRSDVKDTSATMTVYLEHTSQTRHHCFLDLSLSLSLSTFFLN